MSYKNTAVDWASFTRELFMEYVDRHILAPPMQLHGTVEIDESLFGRKVKYNRGNAVRGLRVWILWLIERDSGKIILYPVEELCAAMTIACL